MLVKVNRVNSKNEIQQLLSEGVDIIGISIKLSDTNSDSRALSLSEIKNIQSQITIPNLSLNLNLNEYRKEDISRLANLIKPNSLNLFIEANSLRNPSELNEEHLSTIQVINETELDVISFGNGFGYDGPSTIPDSLGVYKNIKYQEVNIDTLGSNSQRRIKNKKEWSKLLNIEILEQSKLGDTILESITESMENRPYLVDDRNIDTVKIDKLIEIGAKGITMSLRGLNEDENLNKLPNENQIASMFELKKIIESTRRIKKHWL